MGSEGCVWPNAAVVSLTAVVVPEWAVVGTEGLLGLEGCVEAADGGRRQR